jgi:Ca-activated chloride channel family protein
MTVRFDIETDRPLIGGDSATRHVLATIVAPEGRPLQRPPVNLGLVLDRSGSMSGDKLRLAKQAAVAALRRLDRHDRFTVVVYDDRIDVVVPSTTASSASVEEAARAIQAIEARGSTNLCGGWLRACEQVGQAHAPDRVSRVLLLTDGLANQGIVDHSEILGHAAELRRRGIATTTLGVGADFDEHLLGGMADAGGGHFYYVRRDDEIPRYIEMEVGETLEVTLRDARLHVGPADDAKVSPIAAYPTRREGNEWVIELGDLVSLQELAVPLRISFASQALASPEGRSVGLTFVVRSGGQAASAEAVVQWRIAPAAEVGAQPRNRNVDRAVAQAYAAEARKEAGRLNRDGDYAAAGARLQRTVVRIREYAGNDSILTELARELERDMAAHAQPMEAGELKMRYAASYSIGRSREVTGASRRAPRRERPDGSKPGGSGS